MLKINLIEILSHDVYENIMFEHSLFKDEKRDEAYILLWQTRPSVVMGSFQSVWSNVDLDFLAQNEIALARRFSGGGCVFTDLGNLNISFIFPTKDYDLKKFQNIILKALNEFFISGVYDEHSSLFVEQKKVSGAAFRFSKNIKYFHCSMLINSDIEMMKKVLQSPYEVIKEKGVKSRPVEVENLAVFNNQLTLFHFKERLIKVVNEFYDDCQITTKKDFTNQGSDFLVNVKELRSLKWIIERSPLTKLKINVDNNQNILCEIKGIDVKTQNLKIEDQRSLSQKIKDSISFIQID